MPLFKDGDIVRFKSGPGPDMVVRSVITVATVGGAPQEFVYCTSIGARMIEPAACKPALLAFVTAGAAPIARDRQFFVTVREAAAGEPCHLLVGLGNSSSVLLRMPKGSDTGDAQHVASALNERIGQTALTH